MGKVVQYLEEHVRLILAAVGLLLVAAAGTFHFTFLKVSIDHLLAEVGALLLVLGILHFLFEMRLRHEMLREVAESVLGNQRLHDAGLSDCLMNSRAVNDAADWQRSDSLTIGLQYSPKFFEDFHDVLRARCRAGKRTVVLVLNPTSSAAEYLKATGTGVAQIAESVAKVRTVLGEAAQGRDDLVRLLQHDRVLRYSFIQTDSSIWIKFFTNSKDRASVPAIRLRADSPFYGFANDDIERLIKASTQ